MWRHNTKSLTSSQSFKKKNDVFIKQIRNMLGVMKKSSLKGGVEN
jgi:hypothetical protein